MNQSTRALRRQIRYELHQAKYAQGQEEMTLELLNQRRAQTTDKAQTLDDRLASIVDEDEESVGCQLEEATNELVYRAHQQLKEMDMYDHESIAGDLDELIGETRSDFGRDADDINDVQGNDVAEVNRVLVGHDDLEADHGHSAAQTVTRPIDPLDDTLSQSVYNKTRCRYWTSIDQSVERAIPVKVLCMA